MNFPAGWQKKASLTTLPGQFCCHKQRPRIQEAISDFFLNGHPIHLLARKVKLICESPRHAALCPHDIEIEFSFDDFKRVFLALEESGAHRPNMTQELCVWARRMLYQDPGTVLAVIKDLPSTRRAIASVVKEQLKAGGDIFVPIGVVFSLIQTCHLSLDLINLNFLEHTRYVIGPGVSWPTPEDAAAYADLKTWLLYLESRIPFGQVSCVCRSRIKTTVLSLCYDDYSSLPVLPKEIVAVIFKFLDKV